MLQLPREKCGQVLGGGGGVYGEGSKGLFARQLGSICQGILSGRGELKSGLIVKVCTFNCELGAGKLGVFEFLVKLKLHRDGRFERMMTRLVTDIRTVLKYWFFNRNTIKVLVLPLYNWTNNY